MSQLEQDVSDDDALSHGLRPEEDPWSSLAVADDEDDDSTDDDALRSPVICSVEADGQDAPEPDQTTSSPGFAVRRHVAPADRFVRREFPQNNDAGAARVDTRPKPVPASATVRSIAPGEATKQALVDDEDDGDQTVLTMLDPAIEPTRGGVFTIPLLCAGIAIIACCLLIPQADANRRLAYERVKLQADLEAVERQVAVNEDFLKKVSEDPNVAERLAQRQMKIIRPGTKVLALEGEGEHEMSPFQLTAVAPPPELPPYEPRGGMIARLCYNPKSRLYLLGIGLLMTAFGLVLGVGPRSPE